MDFLRRAVGRGPAEVREVNPLEIAKPRADPATADLRVLHFNDGTTFEGSNVSGMHNPAFGNEAALRERYPAAAREPFDEEGMLGEEDEEDAPLTIPATGPGHPALEATSAVALAAALARSGAEGESSRTDSAPNAKEGAIDASMSSTELTHGHEKLIHLVTEALVEGTPEALEALSHGLALSTGGVVGLAELGIMAKEYAHLAHERQHVEHLLKECKKKRKANLADKDLESLEKCLGYAADQLGKKSDRLKVKLASTVGQITGAVVSLAGGAAGGILIVASTGAKSTIPLYQVGRSVYKRLAGTRGEMRTMFARGVFELAQVDHGTRNPDAQRMAKELLGLAEAGESKRGDAIGKLKKFASSMA